MAISSGRPWPGGGGGGGGSGNLSKIPLEIRKPTMRIFITRSFMAGIALFAITSSANASYVLTMQQVAPGALVSGQFEGHFSAAGLGIDLSSISNVRFNANFIDDNNDSRTSVLGSDSAPIVNAYSCQVMGSFSQCLRESRVSASETASTEQERGTVAFGSGPIVASSATIAVVNNTTSSMFLGYTLDQEVVTGTYYSERFGYLPFYVQYFTGGYRDVSTKTYDYTGSMSMNYNFDNSASDSLNLFRSSGDLFASFNFLGDARFEGATLSFDALAAAEEAAVPEPASFPLILAGLALTALARRRRKH